MKTIKLICSDIDGTLNTHNIFNHDIISPENITAIADFVSKGNNSFILATGRCLRRARYMADLLESKINKKFIPFVISSNGAMIFDNVKKQPVYETVYETDIVKKSCCFLLDKHKNGNIFILDQESEVHAHSNFFSKLLSYTWFFKHKKVKLNFQNLPSNVRKIVVIFKNPVAKIIKQSIEDNVSNVYVSCFGSRFLEIVDKRINKFWALERVMKLLDVTAEETCTIGNEGNDLQMLQNTGFSSAVDFDQSPHLSYDKEKINFHCKNKEGTAVFQTIEKLKQLGHI